MYTVQCIQYAIHVCVWSSRVIHISLTARSNILLVFFSFLIILHLVGSYLIVIFWITFTWGIHVRTLYLNMFNNISKKMRHTCTYYISIPTYNILLYYLNIIYIYLLLSNPYLRILLSWRYMIYFDILYAYKSLWKYILKAVPIYCSH